MSLEGQIQISIDSGSTGSPAVTIQSTRPVHASSVLHDKSVDEALQMLPMIFNVCGTAQACAGVRAAEQALSIKSKKSTEQLRQRLVAMETIKEHLWRILLDWPPFINLPIDHLSMAEVMRQQREYLPCLCGSDNPFLVGSVCEFKEEWAGKGALDAIRTLLKMRVLGCSAEQWLEIDSHEGLLLWATQRKGIAAQIVDQVISSGWSHLGESPITGLPQLPFDQLKQKFEQTEFVATPLWDGISFESSPLSRTSSPLIEKLQSQYGNALLVRVVARLTELSQLVEHLGAMAEFGGIIQQNRTSVGSGIGMVEAARGRLYHQIELNGNRISRYRILAPTEWNFAPKGVVASALTAIAKQSSIKHSRELFERQARLFINVVDPCVGYTLSLN